MAHKKVLVIVGPTASGKSDLAVRLAKKFGGEIISADSRQVYKGLDIGTGKITKKEMRGIPHHLLDMADPKKQFSVSDFLVSTNQAIAEIVDRGKLPIVVGGTGFYIDALAGKISLPDVPPDKLLRRKLNKLSKEKLFSMLKEKDPKRAKTIDFNNKVRLIRALEIVEALGKVPGCQPGRSTPYKFIYIGLKPDDLEERIRERIHKWLKNGLIREVKELHDNSLSWKRLNEIGLIYRSVAKYLQYKITKEETINEIFKDIRQYAKRQMAWFKRNKKIKWFSAKGGSASGGKLYKEIEKYAISKL